MKFFNDTSHADLFDLSKELAKKEIFFQEVVNVTRPGIDCLAYKKIYPFGKEVGTLVYVTGCTDVADLNGRRQYNGIVSSFGRASNGGMQNDSLNHAQFENANYLGLWLLISATNQAVIEGSENYERIKDQLEAE